MSVLGVNMSFLDTLQNVRIAVIGDVMLDQYFYGEVIRVSPEAPVPINHVRSIKSVLGGASNVASNLVNLGCQVYLGAISGNDANGRILRTLLENKGIECSGLAISSCRPTITKIRVLGMGQQMLRLDFEETEELYAEEISNLKEWFTLLLEKGLDGVLISDYAKGVCSVAFCKWVIAKAKEYNIPILVDPKGKYWDKYVGCDFITPNVKELSDVSGYIVDNKDVEIALAARKAKETYAIKNVVVTRSEKGISLFGEKEMYSPAVATEVFDVTGCGDTVAAVLLISHICGLHQQEALNLANRAASVVISKVGTYPIHKNELQQVIMNEQIIK